MSILLRAHEEMTAMIEVIDRAREVTKTCGGRELIDRAVRMLELSISDLDAIRAQQLDP